MMATTSVFPMVLELMLQFSLKEHVRIKYPNYIHGKLEVQSAYKKNTTFLSSQSTQCKIPSSFTITQKSKCKDYI